MSRAEERERERKRSVRRREREVFDMAAMEAMIFGDRERQREIKLEMKRGGEGRGSIYRIRGVGGRDV